MKRLVLPLMLLTAACAGADPRSAPRSAEDRQNDAVAAACRADAERQMRYRERGQTMRVDEAESRLGAGAFIGNPIERSQLGARFERDQMIQDCIRGNQAQNGAGQGSGTQPGAARPATTPPAGSGRGS
ncbi:hypothetical protein NON00_10905 [Roseomonas sp. GC11]|uniref:hypothetical protein n=1 Tax=Roseomonas sp. GC11 TaxID=2950546 RepID=UPI00210B9CD8|nr:hypothetical protein [Roseomonas sp. GC11]MCQ4160437.1 hypothetical protein [Roseomonas sp. GC11]